MTRLHTKPVGVAYGHWWGGRNAPHQNVYDVYAVDVEEDSALVRFRGVRKPGNGPVDVSMTSDLDTPIWTSLGAFTSYMLHPWATSGTGVR